MCRLIDGDRGVFTADHVKAVLRPVDDHYPRTKLVCLENTHNRGGGRIYPLQEIEAIAQVCQEQGLKLHLDGARFWNACIATGISEADYARPFDSISVCFSKGLGAPVGSALVGSKEFIARSRRFRKMFGGAMRQAGILAAGALYALKHHRERLRDDHDNARRLAEGLQAIPGIEIDPSTIQTNIVRFDTTSIPAPILTKQLGEQGMLVLATGANSIRAVTNLMVNRDHIHQALKIVESILQSA